MTLPAPMRVVELFSCAGGMAEGFRRAGLPVSMAFDRDPVACESYELNLGHAPILMDVRDLLRMTRAGWSPGPLDLVVADPPCSPWSRAGKRLGLADERDALEVTRDLISAWRPHAYLIGNVPGLEDKCNLPVVQEVLAPLADAGYCVADYRCLNAADYGVPQKRVRPFWFGHLCGPCLTWPAPTHCNPVQLSTGQLFDELAPWRTVREALAVLPPQEWGEPMRRRARPRGDGHPFSRPDEPAYTITTKVSTGGSVLLWPWDRPATPVCCDPRLAPPGHHGGTGYHSSPNAIRLTARAAAILQDFPPEWRFAGTSNVARFRQIGMAMPPGLAAAVAGAVRDWFGVPAPTLPSPRTTQETTCTPTK
jgi:DNA (cytosine-5)-methyltransferase 1